MDDPETLVRSYLDAVVEVAIDGGTAVVEPAPAGTVDGEFPAGVGTIHVVTACNPRSQVLSVQTNAARNAQLAADLADAGLEVLAALGRSRDGAWREPSFAVVDAPPEVVLGLAERHGQHAVYAWSAAERAVVWAGAHRGRVDRQGWRRRG